MGLATAEKFPSLPETVTGDVGGTVGAQIQQGYVVIGVEGDLDWADITGSRTTIPAIAGIPIGGVLNFNTKWEALGTVRARAGVALNNWLIYATGGAAFVKETASGTTFSGVPCGTLGFVPSCADSHWRPGLAAGAGFEQSVAEATLWVHRLLITVFALIVGLLLLAGWATYIRLFQKIADSEQKYRHLIDTAGEAIFILDGRSAAILDANRKGEQILGGPVEQFTGTVLPLQCLEARENGNVPTSEIAKPT